MRMEDIDFLVIGAAKSATTWLQQALQTDPAIRMPDPELHYFSRNFERGDAWYLAQFPAGPGAVRIGEKSNSYMEAPWAVDRIHRALPHVRLIAQLRDPVERAYSDYCMLYRRGEVGGDVDRLLDPRIEPNGRFVAGGLYSRQLAPFFDRIGAERIHVLLYEDLKARPARELAGVRTFLGLDEASPAPIASEKRVKDRTTPVVPPRLKRALSSVKPLAAPLRGGALFERMRGLVAREIRYPALSADVRARLTEFYAPEIDRMAALLGRDLLTWRAPKADARPLSAG